MSRYGEPWAVFEYGTYSNRNIVGHNRLGDDVFEAFDMFAHGDVMVDAKNVARRIVLCINVCAGMADGEVRRLPEMAAALEARQSAIDSLALRSMEIHANEEALETVCVALGWDTGNDVRISATLAASEARGRIQALETALRNLIDECGLDVDDPRYRTYKISTKRPELYDPVEEARKVLGATL